MALNWSRRVRPFSVSLTWIERRQLADRHLGVADVEQHQALHVVDVVNPEPVELQLHHFEKVPVKPLDQRDHLEIPIRHNSLVDNSLVR
jgi:hypothetical protein